MIVLIIKQHLYSSANWNRKPNWEYVKRETSFIQENQYNKAILMGNMKRYNITWPDKIERQNIVNQDIEDIEI